MSAQSAMPSRISLRLAPLVVQNRSYNFSTVSKTGSSVFRQSRHPSSWPKFLDFAGLPYWLLSGSGIHGSRRLLKSADRIGRP